MTVNIVLLCLAFHGAVDIQRSVANGFLHRTPKHHVSYRIEPSPDPAYEWFVFAEIPSNELPKDLTQELGLPGVTICPGTFF